MNVSTSGESFSSTFPSYLNHSILTNKKRETVSKKKIRIHVLRTRVKVIVVFGKYSIDWNILYYGNLHLLVESHYSVVCNKHEYILA